MTEVLALANPASMRVVDVKPGLYVLRYISAQDERVPPFVEIGVSSRDRDRVEIVPWPGDAEGVLEQPGSILVVRVEAKVSLRISVHPRVRGGSIAADVRLEDIRRLSGMIAPEYTPEALDRPVRRRRREQSVFARRVPEQDARRVQENEPPAYPIVPVSLSRRAMRHGLEILAHVSRRGDTEAGEGEWIGGPRSLNPIEGLLVQWHDKPADADLVITGRTWQRGRGRAAPQDPDGFVGTRQQAAPLVQATLELVGRGASRFALEVEYVFAGGSVAVQSGQFVTLRGPSGTEPLVGLKLSVVPAQRGRHTVVSEHEEFSSPRAGQRRAGSESKVKLFKRSSAA